MSFVEITCLAFVLATVLLLFQRPEIALAAQLLGSPAFAVAFRVFGLEGGLVYLLFALSCVGLVIYRVRTGIPFVPITKLEIITFLLVAMLAFSLTYTSAPDYGLEKVLKMCGMAIPVMCMGRYFSKNSRAMRRTLDTCGVYSIAIIALFSLVLLTSDKDFERFSAGANPLVIGYTTVLAMGLTLHLALSTENKLMQAVCIFSLGSGGFIVLATGSRGPTLAVVAAFVFTYLRGTRAFQSLACLSTLALVLFVGIQIGPEQGVKRIFSRTNDGRRNTDARFDMYSDGLKQARRHPIAGGGVGSFATFRSGIDERLYPHNMIVEIASETGLSGLSLFALLMFFTAKRLWKLRSSRRYPTLGNTVQLIFWIGFINSMFSFDLPSQKGFFTALGLIAATYEWNSRATIPRRQRHPSNKSNQIPVAV